jgi:hypothetical protein
MSLTKATYSMISGAPFNVLDYGADPTGVADSRAACQAAINAAQAAGGGVVVIPEGTYLIGGVASGDTVLNGLLVPYVSQYGTANRVIIQGQGRSTILKANSNGMYVIRFSDSNGGVRDLSIDGNSKTSVIGLGCVPQSVKQTTTVVFQNYNIFSGLFILGCAEGFTLKAGPDVAGADSGCWYNVLQDAHIYTCTRGIWLQDGTNASSSPANRNSFFNIRIGQTTNTGVQIDAGDTNKFYAVNFEGISTGTSPNATPTALYIRQTSPVSLADNINNEFFGCTFEANDRDLDNFSTYSQFFGCNMTGTKVNNGSGAGYGLLFVGGNDSSQVPQVYGGGTYQTNSQITGLINGTTFRTTSGTAQLQLNAAFESTTSFQEKSGSSGSIANGATFAVTIPTPRRPQLLFVYTNFNLNNPGLYLLCGDGSGNITVTNIVSQIIFTVAGTAANTITITNAAGASANIYYTLTPFGAAAA